MTPETSCVGFLGKERLCVVPLDAVMFLLVYFLCLATFLLPQLNMRSDKWPRFYLYTCALIVNHQLFAVA